MEQNESLLSRKEAWTCVVLGVAIGFLLLVACALVDHFFDVPFIMSASTIIIILIGERLYKSLKLLEKKHKRE